MNELIYDKETKDKLLDLYLQNLQTASKLIDTIIPVVWKFDGKVYNARFENALKDVLGTETKEPKDRIYPSVQLSYKHLEINLSFWNNRGLQGKSCYVYMPSSYDEIRIAYDNTDFNTWNCGRTREENAKYYIKDNGSYFYIDDNYNTRIQSSRIVDLLLERQKELKEKIVKLQEERKTILEVVQKLEGLKQEIDRLRDSTDHTLKDFYDLKMYATWN